MANFKDPNNLVLHDFFFISFDLNTKKTNYLLKIKFNLKRITSIK